MSRATEAPQPFPGGNTAELLRVFETARRFISCRTRAATLAERSNPVGTLADAIERDFLIFDLARAERALREAVIAIDPTPDLAGIAAAGRAATPRARASDPGGHATAFADIAIA
jgi:hypothetical protein